MARTNKLHENEVRKMVYTKQELEHKIAKWNLIQVDIDSLTQKIHCCDVQLERLSMIAEEARLPQQQSEVH